LKNEEEFGGMGKTQKLRDNHPLVIFKITILSMVYILL